MSAVANGFGFEKFMPGFDTDDWRSIDQTVARWVCLHGGPSLLARVAGLASQAEGRGDTALPLGDAVAEELDLPSGAALRDQLQELANGNASGWIHVTEDTPGISDAPFVLDREAFYLRRNFLHEVAVAALVRRRVDDNPTVQCPVTDGDLRALFNDSWTDAEGPQREAVRRSLGRRLFVLTGGPGTGKTTTVLRILLALVREHQTQHGGLRPTIRLAAPTGKAAQRLTESLRHGAKQVTPTWEAQRDVVMRAETSTLHRLLGSRGLGGGFTHGADSPLDADIVVVDETSMIDLSLLRATLEALPQHAVLVLVGDADQLASVGTGTVMDDLVQALEGTEAMVRLEHSFRAETELSAINAAVRSGDAGQFEITWGAAGDRAGQYDLPTVRLLRPRLAAWSRKVFRALESGGVFELHGESDGESLKAAYATLKEQQLLCALREGPFGSEQASAAIERVLQSREQLVDWQGVRWFPGRAVIIRRNDYASGLFNGDIGLCLRVENARGLEHLQVVFEPLRDAGEGQQQMAMRFFDPESLPDHESAFALTVHKSQGSEYRDVAVLLPPDAEHPLLVRQMLYTALSRARERVEIWAEHGSIQACLKQRLTRAGRLVDRISSAT